MAKVLTAGSKVECGHTGTLDLTTSPKLKIAGSAVVTAVGPAVNGCATPDSVPSGTKTCHTASPAGGKATKLKVGGSAAMLDTVSGITDGVPPGTVTPTANQEKLTAS